MVKRLGQGVADRFHKTVQVTEGLPDGNQLAALTLHGLFSNRTPSSPANPANQVVAHTLGFSSSSVNLSRVFFEHLHPILDIGCSTLRVVPHAHALPRHHGADLGPQFFAGVLGRSKPGRKALFERVPVHAIRVARRMAAFMQRRLVVAVPPEEVGRLREHHLVFGDPIVGPVAGDVLHQNTGTADDPLRLCVRRPFGRRLPEE